MRRTTIAAALLAWAVASIPASGQQTGRDLSYERSTRRALLIGNDAYRHVRPLVNAANDARDLAEAFAESGFEAEVVLDADLRAMGQAIDRFVAELQPGDTALFHFSGHGLQVEQENYLIPVDFELKDPASLRYDAYSASKVHDRIAATGARLTIVTLDACRNNRFSSTRGAGGLAAMAPAHGAFIAFATGPGRTADDNPDGRNGLFTAKLLEALRTPGLELTEVFRFVREEVSGSSGGRQVPWTISSVLGRFYFHGSGDAPDRPIAAPPPEEVETPADPGPPAGTVRVNAADGREYAWIPPGSYRRGCVTSDAACQGDERPRHEVRLSRGFWMSRTEATVADWKRFTKERSLPMPWAPGFIPGLPFLPPVAKGHNPGWKLEDHPIVMIDWNWADRYCREEAGGRLPTEAEWEYAARGGLEDAVYPWGDELTHERANYGKDVCCGPEASGRDQWLYTAPVASFDPNGFGLYDMTGNVWEWVRDWYGDDDYESAELDDPRGPESGAQRGARGGAWDNTPEQSRISDRHSFAPAVASPYVGFRCVVFDLPD